MEKMMKINNNELTKNTSRANENLLLIIKNKLKEFNELYAATINSNDEKKLYYNFSNLVIRHEEIKDIVKGKSLNDTELKKLEEKILNLYVSKIKNILNKFIVDAQKGKKKAIIVLSHLVSSIDYASNYFINKNHKDYFSLQKKQIKMELDKKVFNKDITNSEFYPEYVSLYVNTNFKYSFYKTRKELLSPREAINGKTGDCSEYAITIDMKLKKNGYKSIPIILDFKYTKERKNMNLPNEIAGHVICLIKDKNGNWDYADTQGYWNMNWKEDEIISSLKKFFKTEDRSIDLIHKINATYTEDGDFAAPPIMQIIEIDKELIK